jgi:hypothetical protein
MDVGVDPVLLVVLGLEEDGVEVEDQVFEGTSDRGQVPQVAVPDEVADDLHVVQVLSGIQVILQEKLDSLKFMS